MILFISYVTRPKSRRHAWRRDGVIGCPLFAGERIPIAELGSYLRQVYISAGQVSAGR